MSETVQALVVLGSILGGCGLLIGGIIWVSYLVDAKACPWYKVIKIERDESAAQRNVPDVEVTVKNLRTGDAAVGMAKDWKTARNRARQRLFKKTKMNKNREIDRQIARLEGKATRVNKRQLKKISKGEF